MRTFTIHPLLSRNIILFLILIICGSGLAAQNYQNICSPGVTYYKNRQGNFGAFRKDSIHNPFVGDTMFISYTALRDPLNTGDCADISNGSVLGRKVFKKNDGWFYFFNMNFDSVRINTKAALNQSWRLFDQPNYYLEGKVTSIGQDSVLGMPDQIKIITIQAKDYNGVNISHKFNNKQFKLSEHYGLSQVYDIYKIPSDTVFYSLIGKASPALGVQDLTWQEVYDFDPGDEFHHFSSYWYNSGQWFEQERTWTIKRILDKTVYGNIDSVTYLTEFCYKKGVRSGPDSWTYSYHFDTITEKYKFNLPVKDSCDLRKLPNELLDNHLYTYRYLGYYHSNGRPLKYIKSRCYSWYQGCYNMLDEYIWKGDLYKYAKGIGSVLQEQVSDEYHHSTSLVYYKKGNETWGTPVANDCHILVGTDPPVTSAVKSIKIIPNPVRDKAEVLVSGLNDCGIYWVQITDVYGREVLKKQFSSSSFTIDCMGLAKGLYNVIIWTEDATFHESSKFLVVK